MLFIIISIARPARGNHGPRDKLVNTPPSPVPLDSHAGGHTKVYFLIAMNEGIASELLARNRWRISVPMARVACMHPYQQMGVINLFNTGKFIISSHKDAM
jgi:hypothetical protein